jgi:LPXTG-motif cell wall-anchored protein
MSKRLRSGAAASFALAALLAGASVLLGASSAQALPQALPLQVSFTDLLPGDVRSTSWPVQVPRQTVIVQAALHKDGAGDLRWTTRLCPVLGGSCLDLMTAVVGTPVAAGAYELEVGLTVLDMQPGQSQSLEGRFTLVEDGLPSGTGTGTGTGTGGGGGGGVLASTGFPAQSLGLTAVAVAVLGVLLVVLARRRRDDSPTDVPPAERAP